MEEDKIEPEETTAVTFSADVSVDDELSFKTVRNLSCDSYVGSGPDESYFWGPRGLIL